MQDKLEANIGLSILERFTPTFDYTHKRLILEKNEKFTTPFIFNKSGIIINPKRADDGFLIADIVPSSPASEKKLQAGDKVVSINGKKVSGIPAGVVDDLINGKLSNILNLVLLRNGKEIQETLKLREVI
jgi:C-terminal processing protease CtpA/Prc